MLKEIKVGRLVLAILATLAIADTLPHPSLSAGVIESVLNHSAKAPGLERAMETAITDPRD